jgi:hypothetical protein
MAARSGRYIPEELHPIGEMLAQAGMSTASIQDVFLSQAKINGFDVTWNIKDVYDWFPPNVVNRQYDAAGLAQLLQKRSEEKGLKYKFTTDQAGFTTKVFAQLEGSTEEWARALDHNVVLFDPTHGTNRYGMKLCCFTTVGPTGQTVILAFALIKFEDKADIEWAFRCFAETFKTPPFAVYTDGAGAIESAFEEVAKPGDVWHGSIHILCVYHLSKNFWQHLRPLFVTKPQVWHKVHSLFWSLAKNSDVSFKSTAVATTWSNASHASELDDSPIQKAFKEVWSSLEESGKVSSLKSFDGEWEQLVNLVDEEGHGSTKEEGMRFLTRLYSLRSKWAACFTWGRYTWGLNSTQRSEAVHSAIKRRRIMANYQLVKLIEFIVDYNNNARERRNVDDVRKALVQVAKSASAPRWVACLGPADEGGEEGEPEHKLTTYGYELLMSQMGQALHYRIEGTDATLDGCQVYILTRDRGSGAQPREQTYNEEGVPHSYEDGSDMGLCDTLQFRLTTVNECSCQLKTSLRVPCRHILALRVQASQLPGQVPLIQIIGEKWHQLDAKERSRLVTELIMRPFRMRTSSVSTERSTRQGRLQLLLHELASIAELGAESDMSMQCVLDALPGLASKIRSTKDGEKEEEAAAFAAYQAADEAEPADATSGGGADAQIPIKQQRDYKYLMIALGQRFEVDPTAPTSAQLDFESEEGQSLSKRFVVFKWGDKQKGKWKVGKVDAQIPSCFNGESNFWIQYPEEEDVDDGILELATHITYPEIYSNCDVGRWTLLREKELGQDVVSMLSTGDLHNPQEPPAKRGKKESKRKKPFAGPTA